MVRRVKRGAVLIGLSVMLCGAPAMAQDNLDRGKTLPQVYATDCGICHGDARKIAAAAAQRTRLAGFLEQHYTTSKAAAAAIAGYLAGVAQGERQPRQQRTGRRSSAKKSN